MSYQWICSTSTKRLPKESRSPYRNLLFVNVIITIWNMQMKLWWWLLHKEPHREVSKGKLKERTNCTKNTYVQNQKKTDLILDLQQRRRIKRFYGVQWRRDCREAWSSISWGGGGARHREEEFDLNWKYYLNSVDSLKKRHLNKKCHLYDQHPSKASNKNADGRIAMFHRLCKGIL